MFENKLKILVLLVLTLGIGFLLGYSVSEYKKDADMYVPFMPLSFSTAKIGVRYFEEPGYLDDSQFIDNLIIVFEFNRIPYEILNGKVYVKKDILKDLEMVTNYTRKAKSGDLPRVTIIEQLGSEYYLSD